MFSGKYRICELFGIPIYLDFSLIILLLMFSTGGGDLLSGLFAAFLLLASITLHELGHALTARAFGYRTHDITLSLLGGCASLIALPRKPSQEFLTAVAGPAVSFVLSFLGICGLAICSSEGSLWSAFLFVLGDVLDSFGLHGLSSGNFFVARSLAWLAGPLFYLAAMNAMLGFFNLLPGFPMDGGRIFRSAMRAFMSRARATYIAMVVGRVFAILLALSALNRILHGGNWGFVSLLIAWMIWREGEREYRQVLAEGEWGGRWDFSARVSPPPYGGDEDETEIRRGR
mgnify:FL=1